MIEMTPKLLLPFGGRQSCNVVLLDLFSDECTENTAEECSEFRADVPLSEQFDSEVFEQYCG